MSTEVAPLALSEAAHHHVSQISSDPSAMFAPNPFSNSARHSGIGIIRNPMSQSLAFWRLLLTGIALVMIAASWLMSLEDAKTLDKFGVSTFYGGRKPKSSWVSVNGRLLWDGAAYEGTDYLGTWYVPMVSRNWQWGDEVKLVVKVSSTTAEDWGEMEEVEGMLDRQLPNFVEKFFKEEGPQPSTNVMLLRAGVKPGEEKRFAHIVIVVGFLLIGGSLLLYDPNPGSPAKRTSSLAKSRLLGPRPSDLRELTGEVGPQDPLVKAREDEIERWKREHGLTADEPEAADEAESEEQLA